MASAPPAPLPPSGYVRLTSADGRDFLVTARHASVSPVLAAMLGSGFLEHHTRTIHLPTIRGETLEKVCHYLHHAVRQQDWRHDGAPLPPFALGTDENADVFAAALYLDL